METSLASMCYTYVCRWRKSDLVKALNLVVTLENECIEHGLAIDHRCGFPVALCISGLAVNCI